MMLPEKMMNIALYNIYICLREMESRWKVLCTGRVRPNFVS